MIKNGFTWDDIPNLFDEIQYILIIDELNIAPVDFFFGVFFLLHFKNMLLRGIRCQTTELLKLLWCFSSEKQYANAQDKYLIKMLLEFLICQIDAKLLKAAIKYIT